MRHIIYNYSTIHTILTLRKVCLALEQEVKGLLSDAYCIDRLLLGFFSTMQIPGFMSIQSHTGALIAGSIALKFLLRDPSLGQSPLTLYVESFFKNVITDFLQTAGYTVHTHDSTWVGEGITADWDTTRFSLLDKALMFTKELSTGVRVIEVGFIRRPPIHVLFCFRSSEFIPLSQYIVWADHGLLSCSDVFH
jgi:hypothetical protein